MTDGRTDRVGLQAAAGSPEFARFLAEGPGTPTSEADALVERLNGRKRAWARLPVSERVALLEAAIAELRDLDRDWIEAELSGKGNPPGGGGEAEEWVVLATVFRALRKLRSSLQEIDRYGHPMFVGGARSTSDGTVGVRSFPKSLDDRLLFPFTTGEVWMEAGVGAEDVVETQALAYGDDASEGKVALVLGAGNAAVLPVADLLHKLFVELQVVVLKMNPVNAYMGPLLAQAFRALIDAGFLAIVYGGVEIGAYLCHHPGIDEIHMTGSDKTYEAIVFGPGAEGQRRKGERAPVMTKRFTAELGNVSPVIVVPGPWSRRDIERQARYVATWLVANAGFACLTPRVLIQHGSWSRRPEFLGAIGQVLAGVPTRNAYYPGARRRHAEFSAHHPGARHFGGGEEGHLPWTLVPDLDPSGAHEICFEREAFLGLCAETAIEAPDVPTFLRRAVAFANDRLWGTLSATLVVHPKSLRDAETARAVDRALADLRYGTVSTNMLSYYSAYLMGTPWGAYPGSDAFDIQSGIGKTFNTLMFGRAAKSVVRAPFRRLEPTLVTSRHAVELCRRLAAYEARPSPGTFTSLAVMALRSLD